MKRLMTVAMIALCIGAMSAQQMPAKPASPLPALKRQATPQAVVNEHVAALNACDWNRLMAQYPEDAELFFPGGQVIKGRQAIGDLFRDFVKPHAQGGLCGLTFTAEQTLTVGTTLNVQWRAIAPFLSAPYLGADAYGTKDGLMQAQVTTFDGTQLKMK